MNLIYILKEGYSGFKRAKLAAAASVITISISLLLVGLFLIVSLNTSRIISLIEDKVEIEAFLQEPITKNQINEVQKSILFTPGVDSVQFISKEEAAQIFRQDFGEDIYSVLDFNPLPPSFKISLKDHYKKTELASRVVESIRSIKGVEEVAYRKELIDFLEKRTLLLNIIGLVVGIIFGVSAIFLVANTIRLAIYSKRKIIQTMKLVGATKWFIRTPFLLEGILQGILGGIFSAIMLWVVIFFTSQWLTAELSEFLKIDFSLYLILALMGAVFGLVGSIISVRRFISQTIVK
ncbi:MAG: permease-like cell division protein FtsX [Bacteroidota bacterium]|nr:permease-like cell division protein FtsX [Bacteroidota bacterium]